MMDPAKPIGMKNYQELDKIGGTDKMEEAKNIFLILDELRENAKQVDNDGFKAV